MDILDFWDWVKRNNYKCLVQYHSSNSKHSSKLTVAINERTLADFTDTFVADCEDELEAKIVNTAIIIDVCDLLNGEYTAEEIWEQRIDNLNQDW